MKKFATIALAVVLSMGILTGCGSSKKAAEATTEVKEETVDYGQGLNEDGTLEGVKATDYVTVCDYSAFHSVVGGFSAGNLDYIFASHTMESGSHFFENAAERRDF